MKRRRVSFGKLTSSNAGKAVLSLILAAAICLVAFTVKGSYYALIVLSCAAIHESGHILAAKLFGVKRVKSSAGLFALSLKYDFSKCSFLTEAAVGCAGALFNMTAALAAALFTHFSSLMWVFFIFSNAALALFNLMPISPLDGFGILKALMCEVMSADTVERLSRFISASFSFAFFVFTVYIQLKVGANLSLMLLSAYLLLNCFVEK